MSTFGVTCHSNLPSHCALWIVASVPSGRAVTSASCAEPNRPMPVPYTPFRLASSFLWKSGTAALTATPPRVFESLNALAAEGAVKRAPVLEVQNAELMGFPTRITVPAALLAAGLRTAHG